MEIRRRGKTWHVDLVDAAGRRVRKTTGRTDKREAQRVAVRLQQEVWDAQAQGLGGRAAVTVADATERYCASLASLGKASAPQNAALRQKTLGLMGKRWGLPIGLLLHDLSPLLLDTLVTKRQSEGNGPQTIAHELKLLRASSKYAHELGLRAADITRWRLPTTTTKTRYLTLDEYRELIAELDPAKAKPVYREDWQGAQDLVTTLGLTGGRWAEVAGLTWDQADAPRFSQCKLWGNKVGKERMAPVTAALRAILQRRWETPGRTGPLVFPTASGSQRRGSCKPILRAMDRLGFNADPEAVGRYGRATVHSLRHTFASWLLADGAGLADIQEMLGHSTMQMTRRYAHLENATVASRMAEKLDALTQGSVP